MSEVGHGCGLDAKSKMNLIPLNSFAYSNETYFLKGERPKFMMTLLSEYAICRKNNLFITKNGIFGVFTIIDKIHLGRVW
jgi:hypothetical protein